MTPARALCLCLAVSSLIPGRVLAQDKPGSKDHPLVSRYEGSNIVKYERKAFEEYLIALGKQVWEADKKGSTQLGLTRKQLVSGTLTRITYLAPPGRSALEIYKNYEEALEQEPVVLLGHHRTGNSVIHAEDGDQHRLLLEGRVVEFVSDEAH